MASDKMAAEGQLIKQQAEQSETTSSHQAGQIENIKVAVRLRPFTEREKSKNNKRIVDIEQNTVALYSAKSGAAQDEPKRFTFDYSYWSHDGFKRRPEDGVNVADLEAPTGSKYVGQERVFEDLGWFLLNNALEGYDSALLAYGQTGSGKSYTVSGYGSNEGILPRFARGLFAELNRRLGSLEAGGRQSLEPAAGDAPDETRERPEVGAQNTNSMRYEVYFSMIEIYNEVVRDLLGKNLNQQQQQQQVGPNSSISARRGLKVREHPKRGFFVENLSSFKCANKEEIERLIEEGQLNKSIVATSMNETSSRGHTIYEFRIRQFKSEPTNPSSKQGQASREPMSTQLTYSVVQLVDLAGSERMSVHTGLEQLVGAGGPATIRSSSSRSGSPYPGDQSGGEHSQPPVRTPSRKQPPARPVRNANHSASSAGSAAAAAPPPSLGQHGSLRLKAQSSAQQLGHHNHLRFKESVSINQSLSALGNCIQVLSQWSQQQANFAPQQQVKPPKIPYRDSVLTKLLNRCCLSGNSKVVIIATLSPAEANYDDTLSTLRFADRAKQIRTHALINRLETSQAQQRRKTELVGALQRENERLKLLIDARAPTTKSDDSSQTSNFDDTENVVENFNGPTGSGSSSSSTNSSSLARRRLANTADSGPAARSRTSVRKQRPNATVASGGALPAPGRSRSRPPQATGADQTTRTAPVKAKSKLAGSASIPALASAAAAAEGNELLDRANLTNSLRKLVSPASNKQQAAAGDKSRARTGSLSDEEEEDRNTVGGSDRTLRGSRNLAQFSDLDTNSPDQLMADDYDLAELLDEIDFNDLANIDEAGILSPDSDDSLAALAEEGLSNEKKMDLLNRLLSNSEVAEKIRKQYERQQARLQRPRRAGAHRNNGQMTEEEMLKITATDASLKKTNPYLTNLNQDEQLTGMIVFIIREGEMVIGKNQDCDVLLFGPELRGRHAKLTRVPIGDPPDESTGSCMRPQ